MSSGSPEVSSFTEAVEQLFTDSGLKDALRRRQTGFGQEAESLFLQLKEQLTKVNVRLGPSQTIKDAAMDQVRQLARSVLALIQE